jgi:CarD family transcriptional regulator
MKKQSKHVVYPGHGVCKLSRLKKQMGGKEVCFLVCKNIKTGMQIFTPENENLTRPLMSKAQANKIIKGAKKTALPTGQWNARYRRIMEQIKTSDPKAMGRAYSELASLKQTKDLSFGERKMLIWVKEMLETEMSLVLGREVILEQPSK